jgi:hypothetical protein
MNWYCTKLIFNITINQTENCKQFDEQLRLVAANTPTEAYFKAKLIGENEQVSFVNNNNDDLQWQFIDVSEVNLLTEVKDGMQLYSTTFETKDSEAYIQNIKLRGLHISNKSDLISNQINCN